MKGFLKLLASRFRARSNNPRPTAARAPLALEELEQRLVPTVTWHGGPVLPHVEVQAVYYGSDWFTSANSQLAGRLDAYLRYLVNSPYLDMLTNAGYGVGRGSFSPGLLVGYNINKSYYLGDSTITANLATLLNYRYLQPNDGNRLYVVFVEPGVAVWAGDHTLGYHHVAQGIDDAVIPYPGGINFTPVPGLNAFDNLTVVTSHELAEAVTDPVAYPTSYGWYGGWFDSGAPYYGPNRGEIGDIAQNYLVRLNGYAVQMEAGKNDWPLSPYGSTPLYSSPASSSSLLSAVSSAFAANAPMGSLSPGWLEAPKAAPVTDPPGPVERVHPSPGQEGQPGNSPTEDAGSLRERLFAEGKWASDGER
jgi:hypothetical protein